MRRVAEVKALEMALLRQEVGSWYKTRPWLC